MGGDWIENKIENTEEQIKGWEKFFDGLKRNMSVIVNEDGSGSEPIGAASLESKLAESEGAKGLVFAGKVTDRIFTLAAGASIDSVLGTSVGIVTRKNGVQAYQIGFMPAEGFQKGNMQKKSVLGLRDAISKTRQNHKKAAEKKAVELFKQMDVINKVIKALDQGKTVATIDFPAAIRRKGTDSQFLGEVLWSDVIQSLCALLKDEVKTLNINEINIGGCCKRPRRSKVQGHKKCTTCRERYIEHKAKAFSNLYLEF
ncbi:hypothetical protein OAV46_04460 [Euryarchaeota archaeon]|nr:hypothetical protein [Euryarchaeota archaeon]